MVRPLGPPARPLPATTHAWWWREQVAPWWRIYHHGRHTPSGIHFRDYGALHRFDHHTPRPPAIDPAGRSALYLGVDLATSACEVFGEAGTAQLCPAYRVAQIIPARPVLTLDLHSPGAAMSIGAIPALASGNEPRALTQQWARAIYEDQPVAAETLVRPRVEGIHYTAAYNHDQALVLWDCPDAVAVALSGTGAPLDLPLAGPQMHDRFLAAVAPLGITTTIVPASECPQCATDPTSMKGASDGQEN